MSLVLLLCGFVTQSHIHPTAYRLGMWHWQSRGLWSPGRHLEEFFDLIIRSHIAADWRGIHAHMWLCAGVLCSIVLQENISSRWMVSCRRECCALNSEKYLSFSKHVVILLRYLITYSKCFWAMGYYTLACCTHVCDATPEPMSK